MKDFIIIKPPLFIRRLFPSFIWKINSEKSIYLTFDDGPIPESTPWTLDTLKYYNAKASFFCVGDNVRKYPIIYQRILSEGHSVGNHTFNHLNGLKSPNYIENVNKASLYIDSKLFRPPYGLMRKNQIKEISKKYKIIMWDVLTADYKKYNNPKFVLKKILSKSKPGSVILLHNHIKAQKNLEYMLPLMLRFFRQKAWICEAIDMKV
jgi:peptidoglycan/xylan/chitin deacetylase (PgdA/CDA1 family)